MPDSSSKGLNSVKKWLFFRRHDALKSLSEPLLNKFLEWNVSNFLAHTILLKVCFQSTNGFTLESMTHCKFSLNSFWSKFLNCFKFSSPFDSWDANSSSEVLISVKKQLLSRKPDKMQIQFEQLLEQILEFNVSNLLLYSILEMPVLELWRFDFSQKTASLESMTPCKFSRFLSREFELWRNSLVDEFIN